MVDKLRSEMERLPYAEHKRVKLRSVHLVWVVPLIAALIGAWFAWNSLTRHGPTITISFSSAEGIEAGKTRLKYKNVDIGVVRGIALSPDLSRVLVTAQTTRDADTMLRADSRFWVVRPRISLSGVSGLGTLVSGVYIGMEVGRSSEQRREFTGLEVPPAVAFDLPGRKFVLRAKEIGSLDIGSPIYFRRIQVGQVSDFKLDASGQSVTLEIFIKAPYDRFVTTQARFWQASGLDFTVDANGFRLDTQSMATLISGGIAFQSGLDGAVPAAPAPAETAFELADSRVQAMKHAAGGEQYYRLYFTDTLRGLGVGAPVDMSGLPVGEVKAVGIEYDEAGKTFRFPVDIVLYPEQMRSYFRRPPTDIGQDRLLERMVADGMRAQLRSANLLTGQMYVALDFFRKEAAGRIDRSQEPARLPTRAGSLGQIQDSVASIVGKLDRIPFDGLSRDLRRALQDLDHSLKAAGKLAKRLDEELAPQAKATLQQAQQTFGAAERILADEAPLQQDLRATLNDVRRAADSLRHLTDYLERHPETLLRGKPKDPP